MEPINRPLNAGQLVFFAVCLGAVGWLVGIVYRRVQEQSIEWRVLYAGATYALAVLVALVQPRYNVWTGNWLAKLALGAVLGCLLVLELAMGSVTGMFALVAVLHQPRDLQTNIMVAVLIWAALEFPLVWWIRRRTLRLQQRS